MANEIEADYATAVTVYGQVRNAIGQIWRTDTLVFEAYATANIANYAITMTEQGTASGLYAGSMSASMAADSYNVIAKQKLTGSFLETDPTIATGGIEWSGTIVQSRYGLIAAIFANVVEGAVTFLQACRLWNSAMGGKASGLNLNAPKYRNLGDTKNRIDATTDASGNRTAVTLDLT